MAYRRLAWVTCLALALPACGNNVKPINPGNSDGGVINFDGGSGGGGGGSIGAAPDLGPVAMIDMAGTNTASSPVVTITSPVANAVVPGDTLNVVATITSPVGNVLDTNTLAILVTPPGGSVISAPLTPDPTTTDQFKGSIDISKVPSGKGVFFVTASDITGLKGSAEGDYTHDHGPLITFIRPVPMSSLAGGVITTQFVVNDTLYPLSAADITSGKITASIQGQAITLAAVANSNPLQATGSFDSNGAQFGSLPLNGPQQITVRATNSNNTTTTVVDNFAIDNSGPAITISSPVGGDFPATVPMSISVTATDSLSPLNFNTATATIGNDANNVIKLVGTAATTGPTSGTFTGTFDLRQLPSSYIYAQITITISDSVGNSSSVGEQVLLDTTPPWLTMDASHKLRTSKRPNPAAPDIECSHLFSPLGDEALKEGQVLPVGQQIITPRARILDHANYAPGLAAGVMSGINPSSLAMFILPDNGTPLAVDTDGDGFCDDVNPLLQPTTGAILASNEVYTLGVAPVALPSGGGTTPDYTPDPGGISGYQCTVNGEANPAVAKPLCSLISTSIDFDLWSEDTNVGNVQLFAPAPSSGDASKYNCLGMQVDTADKIPDGPLCLVTRATDNQANTMVSFPLHVCLQRGGAQSCPSPVPASNCTGTYNKMTKQLVANTPCKIPTPADDLGSRPVPGTFPVGSSVETYFIQAGKPGGGPQ